MMAKKLKSPINRKIKGVQCLVCMARIFSWHRHDFRSCKCKEVFVDGGRDYLRVGFKSQETIRYVYFDSRKDVVPKGF